MVLNYSEFLEATDDLYDQDEEYLWYFVTKVGYYISICSTMNAADRFSKQAILRDVVGPAWKYRTLPLLDKCSKVSDCTEWYDAYQEGYLLPGHSIKGFDAGTFVWDKVNKAVKPIMENDELTYEEIGKKSCLVAQRTVLIHLDALYKTCKDILLEIYPEYRTHKVNPNLVDSNPFMKQFQRLFRNKYD